MVMVVVDGLSVAANSKSVDVFSGTQIAISPANLVFLMGVNGSASGLNLTLLVGSDSVIDDQPISDANRFPVADQDFIYKFGALKTDSIRCFLRNTTVGALTFQLVVNGTTV